MTLQIYQSVNISLFVQLPQSNIDVGNTSLLVCVSKKLQYMHSAKILTDLQITHLQRCGIAPLSIFKYNYMELLTRNNFGI